MGVLLVIAICLAAMVLIGRICDWFDAKTGCIVGAIVAGLLAIFLTNEVPAVMTHSTKPPPAYGCVHYGNCP